MHSSSSSRFVELAVAASFCPAAPDTDAHCVHLFATKSTRIVCSRVPWRCSVDLNLPIPWPLKALSASITCHEFYVAFESFELRDLRVDLRVLQVSLSVGQCNPDSSGTSLTGGFTSSQWNRVALKAS